MGKAIAPLRVDYKDVVTSSQVKKIDRLVASEFETGDWESVEKEGAPWSKELVSAIAMDIGKDVVAYVKVMYPKAVEATSSTFCLSLRNCIHNEIMAAIEVTDEGKIRARMKDRAKFRRWWVAAYKKIRQPRF